MIPLLPIVGPWLVKRLLASKPGRTEPRAEFLAKVIQTAALLALLVAGWLVFDHLNDKAAVREAAVEAVTTARSADSAADSANDHTRNEVEQANDRARDAANGSDDPLADGLRGLRN